RVDRASVGPLRGRGNAFGVCIAPRRDGHECEVACDQVTVGSGIGGHRAHPGPVGRGSGAIQPRRRFSLRRVRCDRRILVPGRVSIPDLPGAAGWRRCGVLARAPRVAGDAGVGRGCRARARAHSGFRSSRGSGAAVSAIQESATGVLVDWAERVRAAAQAETPLRIVGGGTKDFYGLELVGERFDTRAYTGIVDYDPTELVVTVRCGTSLEELERTLAGSSQILGFEPPRFGPGTTMGGCIAAGLAGPRRLCSGAIR